MAHKIDFLYNLPIEKVQNLIKGIATLSKGYLHPKLFHPSFLKEIFDRVAQKLHRDYCHSASRALDVRKTRRITTEPQLA